jgi:hypothetical protein
LLAQWESLGPVRAFAGDNVERAVYSSCDSEFLLELEPHVHHYEIVWEQG